MTIAPRRHLRSVLYVPAANERALAKAATLPCDGVILDLEDAVSPEMKATARENARIAIESGIFDQKHLIVRVNGFAEQDSTQDWLADDLAVVLPAGPHGILIPKIRTQADARRAEAALDAHAGPNAIQLWLMIETPQAIMNINAIAATAQDANTRLSCLVMGTNDLAKEMRIAITPSRLALLHAFSATIIAARACNLDVLDGVYGALSDLHGLESEILQGKGLGFDGKTLIHPNQIELANRIFSPSEVELAEAHAIIAAFEAPENHGKGVLSINGKMSERLHYEIAKRMIGGL